MLRQTLSRTWSKISRLWRRKTINSGTISIPLNKRSKISNTN